MLEGGGGVNRGVRDSWSPIGVPENCASILQRFSETVIVVIEVSGINRIPEDALRYQLYVTSSELRVGWIYSKFETEN